MVVQGVWGVEPLKSILWDLGMTAIPAAVAAAILRYRLFDVDLLISRTLVYGSLTVLLGLAYAGLVLAGQAVFSSFAGGSNLAIAVSTLVVAALFLPLRGRVQRFVDRRFYRRATTPPARSRHSAFVSATRSSSRACSRTCSARPRDDGAGARLALAPGRAPAMGRRAAWAVVGATVLFAATGSP